MFLFLGSLLFALLSYFFGSQYLSNDGCISISTCQLCYKGLNQNFVLSSCTQRGQCLEYSKQNSTQCIKRRQLELNQQTCLLECLFDSIVFKGCMQSKGMTQPTIQTNILVPIFVTIIAIHLIIGGVYHFWKEAKSKNQDNQGNSTPFPQLKNNQCLKQIYQKISEKQKQNLNKWVSKRKNLDQSQIVLRNLKSLYEQNCCSICLDDKPNCRTICKHYFHIHCYITWLSKNQKCPLCNNENYNPITIECDFCHEMQNKMILNKQFDYVSQSKKISCIQCYRKKLQKLEFEDKQITLQNINMDTINTQV